MPACPLPSRFSSSCSWRLRSKSDKLQQHGGSSSRVGCGGTMRAMQHSAVQQRAGGQRSGSGVRERTHTRSHTVPPHAAGTRAHVTEVLRPASKAVRGGDPNVASREPKDARRGLAAANIDCCPEGEPMAQPPLPPPARSPLPAAASAAAACWESRYLQAGRASRDGGEGGLKLSPSPPAPPPVSKFCQISLPALLQSRPCRGAALQALTPGTLRARAPWGPWPAPLSAAPAHDEGTGKAKHHKAGVESHDVIMTCHIIITELPSGTPASAHLRDELQDGAAQGVALRKALDALHHRGGQGARRSALRARLVERGRQPGVAQRFLGGGALGRVL